MAAGKYGLLSFILTLLVTLAHNHAGPLQLDDVGLEAPVATLAELHFATLFLTHQRNDQTRRSEAARQIAMASISGHT